MTLPEEQKAKLERKLERFRLKVKFLHEKYDNNERNYTFHGGYDLGYYEGAVSILEDILDVD